MSELKDDAAADQDKHIAWLDSLSADDKLAVNTPAGYQHFMLWSAYVKRALQQGDMKAGKRLQLLERLNGLTDWYFTPEMLAAIEPMCDTAAEMMREALSLDRDRDCENNFNVLTSWKIFQHFRRLNPSYLAAIKLREHMTATRKAAPAQVI